MSTDELTTGPLKCPACGYALANLPAWHTCPECGVPYDPHSRVHSANVVGKHVTQIVLAVGLGLMALLGFMPQIAAGREHFSDLLYFWGILLVLSLGSIYHLVRSIGAPCRVLISHQGIGFEYPDAKPWLVTWREFDSARISFMSGRLSIWGHDGEQLIRRCDRNIGSPKWRRALAAELNELAKIYSRERPGPSEQRRPNIL